MKLLKANPASAVVGVEELPGKANYFIGNDPHKWRVNVPMFARVRYRNVYPGIDLVYYGDQRQIEYDFVVASGADPSRIQIGIHGAQMVRCDEHGDLVLAMDGRGSAIRWHKPVVYQEKDDVRQEITAHYAIRGVNRVGFEVGEYDPRRSLFIDPLIYSTYLGGSDFDRGYGVAVDTSGNVYVTGCTYSTDFPTANAVQSAEADGGVYGDAFVTKLNPTGSALVYSTYLGGSGSECGNGIAVDSAGNAYVTGSTTSTDFPTMNPLQSAFGGNQDAFVAKVNPDGSTLVYSTYLGGIGQDFGTGIAVDSSGNAYVTGYTYSKNFPTMNPLQLANGGPDAFVAKFNPTGSALVYSTYLGGSATDFGTSIAADNSGNAYVMGNTNSTDFPTRNPLQPANNGGAYDAFVAALNPTGSALVYSTYLGGSGYDSAADIAVDSAGNAYVTGGTSSTDFPTINPLQPSNGGGSADAFAAKLNPTGSALIYSTYLGGSGDDGGSGIAVDNSGNAYIIGTTGSTDFPAVNPFQPGYGGGNSDAFVAKLNPAGSALVYSSYLGGSADDWGSAIAVDTSGNTYVTGFTTSTNFPTMNPVQPAYGGGSYDAFVAMIGGGAVFAPANLDFGQETVGTPSAPLISTLTNTSNTALNIESISFTGTYSNDFSQVDNCGTTLAANGTCNITVTFTPSGAGARTAALSVNGSPQTLPLTGTGVLPAITFSPTSLSFGNQTVNTVSPPQNVTATNTGPGILKITNVSTSGAYSQTNTCGGTVAQGGNCIITVIFAPKATGNLAGTVSITDNAPGSPQSLPLTGVGVLPAVAFSPAKLVFPDQTVFTTSSARSATLTNTGLGVLSITKISASAPFSQTNTCGSSLSSGTACTINVRFAPKAKGILPGSVSVTDNASGSPQTLLLTGTGTYIQFSPTSLSFGNQPVGTKSLSKKITMTNKGSASVSITSIAVAGTNAGDFTETNTCGKTIASGASCFITVTFTPSAKGKRTANVSANDDGGGSPQKVPVSGTGT
jgi:hypothetical protein